MIQVSNDEFDQLITTAMDELPEAYVSQLDNVAITFENEPSPEQRVKLRLRCNQTLYGLYEGVPMTQRGSNYSFVLPDKITIFKKPIEHTSGSMNELKAQIKNTLWHEIGHHYGLDHDRIHHLEDKMHTIKRKKQDGS